MRINEKECIAAGIDPNAVHRIAKNLSKWAREGEALGLTIFGGTTNGTLRIQNDRDKPGLILAFLDGSYDGGCGAETYDEHGLMRGE